MTSASTYSDKMERPSADQISDQVQPQQQPEEVLNLPKRPSPLADEQCILHGKQPEAGQVMILNSQPALQQVSQHALSNTMTELGGVLLGHAYREGKTLVVDIKAAIPAHSDDHGPVHFTFTADAWSRIHKDRAEHYPNLEIVGWFHTHPALGVFYSSDDVVVHSAAFTLPWHVGLVVDPVRKEAAYFGWHHNELAPIAGYYELTDVQANPIVGWKAVRTSVYNVSEMEMIEQANLGQTSNQNNMVYMPDNQWLALSPSSQKLGLIVAILALGLSLFLLVGGIVPLNRQVKEMETVIVNLANSNTNPNAHACPDPRLRFLAPTHGNANRVGSEINFIGTAVYPGATRYSVQVRQSGADGWQELGSTRNSSEFSTLATWNTQEVPAGKYDVRLTAVDANNITLNNSPVCAINIELFP